MMRICRAPPVGIP